MIALVLVLGVAGFAEADRVSFSVLRGEGTSACPNDEELRERVRVRIGSEPFVDDGELVLRELRAGILRDGDALEARVALFAKDGTRIGRRVLRGALDCEDLADDLVLAIAIAIDPLLLVRGRPRAAAPQVPLADAPQVSHPRPAVAAVAEGIPPPVGVVGRGIVSVAAGIGLVAVPSVRVEASLDYGILDVDAGVRLDLPSRYPIGLDALIDLTLIAVDVAPCLGTEIEVTTLRACTTLQAGVLVAQTIGVIEPRAATSPWVALGLRGGVDVRVWPGLGLVFVGELQAPLVRTRFVDDVTRQTFAEANFIVGSLGVGLQLQLR